MSAKTVDHKKSLEHTGYVPTRGLLRLGSQRVIESALEHNSRIGLVTGEEVKFAIMKWDASEQLIAALVEKDEQIEQLQSQLEDVLLGIHTKDAVLKAERGETEQYHVSSIADVFNMIKQ